MRTFIRHPSDIPIEIVYEDDAGGTERFLNNISSGGLSFTAREALTEGAIVRVRITIIQPMFEARGRIVWCRKDEFGYDVGIEFVETKDIFKARMVEQVCHIEHYKREMQEKEGRLLSGREAAMEWISKYAGSFQEESIK
jgi:hypothetical protein